MTGDDGVYIKEEKPAGRPMMELDVHVIDTTICNTGASPHVAAGLRHRRKIILAKQNINDKIALVKYETFFLFICLYFSFVSLILFFPVYFLYLFLFSFLFFFFLFFSI